VARVHAALFDVDGTLLDSCAIDNELYVAAIRHVLGPVNIRAAWEMYPCVSDTGILADICIDNSLKCDQALSDVIMKEFVSRLSEHLATSGPCREIPGALRYIQSLQHRGDVRIAYATGCWRESARLKLSSAGFPIHEIPMASANDHRDRSQIMSLALERLQGPFDSITYFGDATWDQEATAALGWQFVPVGAKLGGITDFNSMPPDHSTRALDRTGTKVAI
jgi:beta-phosphoglucomutase-like phosphatase (HAD superfamily)